MERLTKCEDAEESGLLVKTPCKVGDMVYYKKGSYIYGDTVTCIVLDGIGNRVIIDSNRFFKFSDFGRNVFTSREEAENYWSGKL